jgi:hypothetical protein
MVLSTLTLPDRVMLNLRAVRGQPDETLLLDLAAFAAPRRELPKFLQRNCAF